MPCISVAMPVRDAAPWLAEAVASVLAQDETDFELLAVDDGSGDGSRAILDDLARRDSRMRVLETSPPERGIVPALNRALAEARAPLLARMDADDRMLPGRLAAQRAALESDPSLFAVSCRAALLPAAEATDGMRAYVEWQNSLSTPGEIAGDRFVESPVLHPSVTLRTDVARVVLGGWTDRGWPEDWDFFLRALEKGLRIARVDEVLLEWRVHEAQSTRRHPRYSPEALMACRAHYLARHLARVCGSDRQCRTQHGSRIHPAGAAGPEPPVRSEPCHVPATLRSGDRAAVILGAGPVGKTLVKALALEGCVAGFLVDVDPRKVGGVVRGAGRNWRVISHRDFLAMQPRPYAVSAVAGGAARERVRAELLRHGWEEGRDFVVAA